MGIINISKLKLEEVEKLVKHPEFLEFENARIESRLGKVFLAYDKRE